MIKVYIFRRQTGESEFKGTIKVKDGKVVFDIEDEELRENMSSAPQNIIDEGPEAYLDFIVGRFSLSSVIILEETEEEEEEE